jgi:hypothetical protein
MVHKLFESILGWVIPDTSPRESLEISGKPIPISDFGAQTADESTLLNFTSKVEVLPIRPKPLTPGLKDYLDAVLQPIKSYMSDSTSSEGDQQQQRWTQQNELELRSDMIRRSLQFLPEDEELEWDENDTPRTPASTGLNPALW